MLIAVTGAGGFIGSHLVDRLVSDGHEVRCFIRYNSSDSIGKIDPKNTGVILYYGDLAEQDHAHALCNGCDVVYHLASIISVPYSDNAPWHVLRNNIKSTLNIVDACMAEDSRLVTMSTSEVYGTATSNWPMGEDHRIHPQSIYASSKVCCDNIVRMYCEDTALNGVIIRPFNTYGPRQSKRAVIMKMIRMALAEGKIVVENLDTSRDFTYVGDLVEALVLAADLAGYGKTYNVASGCNVTIGKVAEEIARQVGIPIEAIDECGYMRPNQVRRLLGNAREFTNRTGWEPTISLREGIGRTIEWARNNPDSLGNPA